MGKKEAAQFHVFETPLNFSSTLLRFFCEHVRKAVNNPKSREAATWENALEGGKENVLRRGKNQGLVFWCFLSTFFVWALLLKWDFASLLFCSGWKHLLLKEKYFNALCLLFAHRQSNFPK